MFKRISVEPALSILPKRLNSPEAIAMILAICLQESRLKFRRQIGGPARGFPQFEEIGVKGVLEHPASRPIIMPALAMLCYEPDAAKCHAALEHNDVLACVLARALLYSVPDALPGPNDPEKGWVQYVSLWRPGKPHVEPWANHYRTAWATV